MIGDRFPKGKLRQDQIIDAALEIYVNEGYAALTLSNVAKCAGISPGHVRYYFPSINNIIEKLCAEISTRYKSVIYEEAFKYKELEKPETVLKRLIKSHLRLVKMEETAVLFAEDVAFAERNIYARKMMDDWNDWYIENLSDLVRRINPKHSKVKSCRIAALIVVLMDNLQRFIGERSQPHFQFRGLETDVKKLIEHLIYN